MKIGSKIVLIYGILFALVSVGLDVVIVWMGLMPAQGELFLIVSVLVSVIFTLISVMMAKSLTGPMSELKRAVESVSRGNYDVMLDTSRRDEWGDLTRFFSRMVMTLRSIREATDKKISELNSKLANAQAEQMKNQEALLNVLEDVERDKKVSEQRAIELLKYRQAVENASEHMVITDADGIILFANKSVTKITGFEPEEIIGKKAGSSELWGGLMDKSFYEQMWRRIKTEKLPFGGEVTNKRKSGEKYLAEASISPVVGNDGNVLFFVGIERDITKEREVDRMKTEFISLVTHQLRSPITAVKWALEMLGSGDVGVLDQKQKEILDSAIESNKHMQELVGSLLNISRIESGRIIIEPEPVVLKTLVDGALKELNVQINERRVAVETESSFDDPIATDPKLTREVYKNLLSNAVKYSMLGGVIKIKIYKDGDNVMSKVIDGGLGIPKEEQVHIFQKFYRATNVQKEVPEGTGLGLYLVKQIVESSGGKIGFESEDGVGTTFWFTLPLSGVVAKKGEVSLS